MKILLVNDQFCEGGAGRVACVMCNEFLNRGYELHVATDYERNGIKYPLDKSAKLYQINIHSKKRTPFSRITALFRAARDIRRHIKNIRPDVIIVIQAYGFIRTFIANVGLGYPVIAADHTSFARKMDLISTFTRHYLYKFADGLSILTKRDETILGDKYPQKVVIYNPLSYEVLKKETQRSRTVLAAGRFDIWKIKGFDLLLSMWKDIVHEYPEWKLQIAGTGSDEAINNVKELIRQNSVENSVELLGQVADMKSLYSHSGIFALSSRIEGMPMVLLEAMSQGCPCVAFDVGGAASEMIDENCGIVVPDMDTKAFTLSLKRLIKDDELRKVMSSNAIKSVDKFSVENFMNKWEFLILRTLKTSKIW